ncbi:MAG TPA: hypothetical protein VGA93_04990 [Actinomycetota bacterium]
MAFSAGGRVIATWIELNPEYDVPYIPTVPVDHSRDASHATISFMSRCSISGYSSSARPSEVPVPRTSTRHTT